MSDAYEIYCAWCLANDRPVPTYGWWLMFVATAGSVFTDENDDGEEIFEEIREEAS